MQISQIAALLQGELRGDPALSVSGIQYDSRLVKPGDLFVCLPGVKSDGHLFAPQALAQGASALLVSRFLPDLPLPVPQVQVAETRLALAMLSEEWYGRPSRRLRLVGVTGTNGKTTITYLIKGLLEKAGQRVGLVGTIQNLIGQEALPSQHTTPESLELAGLLRRMADAGCQWAVMEVSSHALKQGRTAGCEFDAAVFTNLTQDHLDYHLTWDDYLASKIRLFQSLGTGEKSGAKYGVVNLDDPAAQAFIDQCPAEVLTYGLSPAAQYRAEEVVLSEQGTDFILCTPTARIPLHLPLMGLFNVYNVLAAAIVALREGTTPAELVEFLAAAPQVPGRFERVLAGQPFPVVVDYAHTPDGLANILKSARQLTEKRLITVFGCGGDRDRSKRPLMGRISGEISDFTILTSDNPRSEEPESILAEIQQGIAPVSTAYRVVPDRRLAIREAVALAGPGDTVVIAGKGHEDYQLVKDQVLHFDDREVAGEALRALGYAIK